MSAYQPNYYGINIRPIFVKEHIEYPFGGLKANRESTLKYKFIIDTLRSHLGDDLEIKEGFNTGTFEIGFLSYTQMELLKSIYETTGAFLINYGLSQLKFEIDCTSLCDV